MQDAEDLISLSLSPRDSDSELWSSDLTRTRSSREKKALIELVDQLKAARKWMPEQGCIVHGSPVPSQRRPSAQGLEKINQRSSQQCPCFRGETGTTPTVSLCQYCKNYSSISDDTSNPWYILRSLPNCVTGTMLFPRSLDIVMFYHWHKVAYTHVPPDHFFGPFPYVV
jgi:hypothetical protein